MKAEEFAAKTLRQARDLAARYGFTGPSKVWISGGLCILRFEVMK
jgi:hypothetical protein